MINETGRNYLLIQGVQFFFTYKELIIAETTINERKNEKIRTLIIQNNHNQSFIEQLFYILYLTELTIVT